MIGKEENTDNYYSIIDELYFIETFDKLKTETNIEENILKQCLWELISNDYVKIMHNYDEEISVAIEEFEEKFKIFHYIASKKGLKWHNSL